MKTDVLKILGKIIPTAIFVLLLPFSIIYMAISKVCSFIRKFFPDKAYRKQECSLQISCTCMFLYTFYKRNANSSYQPSPIIVHPIHCRLVNKATTRKADALVTHLFTFKQKLFPASRPPYLLSENPDLIRLYEKLPLFISASEEKYPFLNPAF